MGNKREKNQNSEMSHWISAAVMEPDSDLIEQLKIRSGTAAPLRNGPMTTLIPPEAVVRRSLAGAFADEAGCGITVMLMEPDIVLIEMRS